MADLVIRIADRVFELEARQSFTFGRDESCTVCLDPIDTGISRLAGSVQQDGDTWWITNRSAKRTLHVVDETGISVPIPVATPAGQTSRRAVDQQSLTILVAGDIWTHAIEVTAMARPGPQTVADPTSPIPTVAQLPTLTDKQREALVALLSGYLKPFPQYDPHPLTYQAAAQLLGVSRSVVVKRVEHFRGSLVRAGVPGLDGNDDARRSLAEWVLSMRLISADDFGWLQDRLAERRAESTPDDQPG